MSIVSRMRSALAGAPARRAFFGWGGRAYDAGRTDTREMEDWNPTINHPDYEIGPARDRVTARSRDLSRNNPIISGGIDRRTEAVVGSRIRLEARPAYEALGRTADWADDWASGVESRFHVWAYGARKLYDVERKSLFGGQVNTAYRHWFTDGEACAVIYQLDRGGTYQTAVKLIDPDRLSNPDSVADNTVLPNGNKVVQGVEIDGNGAPVAYHVRVKHPADLLGIEDDFRWERIERESAMGRPKFIHAYRPDRAEQRRGISRIVASMKRSKMLDRYDNAELEAALLNAINSFVVESPYPTSEVQQAFAPGSESGEDGWSLEGQLAYRKDNRVRVNGTQVIHGLPGEKFNWLKAERPSRNYPDFQAAGLRSIAAQFGLSYPQLSQNWADINYSSARTLLNEIWRGLLDDRWLFTQAFCSPIYMAWLEEDVALGNTKVPGGPLNFYKWRDALCMSDWMGPGRGSVDPLKEANAADLDDAAGRSNLILEAAKQGLDYKEVLRGKARVHKLLDRLGLDRPVPPAQAKPDPNENPDAADVAEASTKRQPAGADA
jgi:lambda family phage portal protein